MGDLVGKVVLVTGAGTGIGAAVAEGFARAGATVAVHCHASSDAAAAVVDRISAGAGKARLFSADLTLPGEADKLVTAVVQAFGRLDVMVNNAGGMVRRVPLLDADASFYDEVLDLNVRSVVTGCQAAVRQFRLQGDGGAIINTGSVAARHGGGPGMAFYAGAKAFVQNFTRNLAKELAKDNIRVNAVAPGVIDTAFHGRATTPEMMEAMRKTIPLGRLGLPADCTGAYLFLGSSEMSAYVTGQTLEVNGGLLML
ncbi:SDR family oxidoreductase [Polaromonas sp. P1(28)-13]|nr:SDR family oxidoreductase [Polaromonas sp. P1(28)-13]